VPAGKGLRYGKIDRGGKKVCRQHSMIIDKKAAKVTEEAQKKP